MRISDWSSDVFSSDLHHRLRLAEARLRTRPAHPRLRPRSDDGGESSAGAPDLSRRRHDPAGPADQRRLPLHRHCTARVVGRSPPEKKQNIHLHRSPRLSLEPERPPPNAPERTSAPEGTDGTV